MSNRNDPDALEAEAKELMDKMTGVNDQSAAAVTDEEQLELIQDAPEPTDTAETVAEDTNHQEGGDSDDDLRLEIAKANKAMKGAQSRMTKATQEAADLKRQNADLLKALGELKSEAEERTRDDSKLEQLREDYPDLAAPLLDELKRTQGQVASQQEALAEAAQRKIDEQNEQVAAAHFARIEAEHPDVNDLIETADWLNWLEEQDGATKQWIQTGSSNDVNTVLHRFKADMGVEVQTPQERALAKAKVNEYAVTIPSGTELNHIVDIYNNNTALKPVSYTELLQRLGDETSRGSPKSYAQRDNKDFYLAPIPAEQDSLRVLYSLKPTATSTSIPDTIGKEYREVISHGALFRLQMMAGQPFSNPNYGGINRDLFEKEVGRTIRQSKYGFSGGSLTCKPRSFI